MIAATSTLVLLGLVSMAFLVSIGGLVIAGAIAIAVGGAVAGATDPPHAENHAAVVAYYVVALAVGYLLVLQRLARITPAGAHGSPGMEVPTHVGRPAGYPPQR